MGIYDAMKEVVALKEAIIAGQDGKIYFHTHKTGHKMDAIAKSVPEKFLELNKKAFLMGRNA